jgi:hypothetical protein
MINRKLRILLAAEETRFINENYAEKLKANLDKEKVVRKMNLRKS